MIICILFLSFEEYLYSRLDKDFVISELIKRLNILEVELTQLKTDYAVLKKASSQLQAENTLLKAEISELESRFKSNSSNSSKPPSSDGYQEKPAFAKKTKGKKGGQKGHKGNNLRQVAKPDKTIKCVTDKCSCGHEFHLDEFSIDEKRQVFDLPQPSWRLPNIRYTKQAVRFVG